MPYRMPVPNSSDTLAARPIELAMTLTIGSTPASDARALSFSADAVRIANSTLLSSFFSSVSAALIAFVMSL